MDSICYIIGALKADDIVLNPVKGDFIIAADGGLKSLEMLSVKADLIIGDFDSLGQIPKGSNVVRYPVEKDDTDTMIAVKEGLNKNYKTFVIYGGLGGRFDHTYANIQLLTYIAGHNAIGYLLGEGIVITSIMNNALYLNKEKKGIISVFSSTSESKGVSISGLKYELKDSILTNQISIGVSNEFIGKESMIKVEDGILVVMWYEGAENFFKS